MSHSKLFAVGLMAGWLSCSTTGSAQDSISPCSVGKVCTVEGTLVGGRGTGSIRGKDEYDCVAVALPPDTPDSWDRRKVHASGMIYKQPDYPFVTYDLKGRTVDAEACYTGLVMFVDSVELIANSSKSQRSQRE
jgi:hypothetical protein